MSVFFSPLKAVDPKPEDQRLPDYPAPGYPKTVQPICQHPGTYALSQQTDATSLSKTQQIHTINPTTDVMIYGKHFILIIDAQHSDKDTR